MVESCQNSKNKPGHIDDDWYSFLGPWGVIFSIFSLTFTAGLKTLLLWDGSAMPVCDVVPCIYHVGTVGRHCEKSWCDPTNVYRVSQKQ